MLTRRYRIEKEIGKGSFAVVMKAFDRVRQIPVAIKKIDIRGPLSLQLIRQEAHILSMLNHPTIVKMYEKIEEDSNVYIIMEYIDGKDLLDYLNSSNGGLSEKESAELFAQMVSGLRYIHSLKIMHRDLKIENFMVTNDGKIKFIDFGCSKNTSASSSSDMFTTMCGSFAYCAPERVASMPYSFEADVWSLGIILYAMVECTLPFKSDDDMEMLGVNIVRKEPNYSSKMSNELIDLLRKILVKNPKLRITIDQITEHPFVKEEYINWAKAHAEEHNKNINIQPVLRSTGGLKTLIDLTCKATANLDDNMYVSPLVPYCSPNNLNNFRINNNVEISNNCNKENMLFNKSILQNEEEINKFELLKNVPFISDASDESPKSVTFQINKLNDNDSLGVNFKEKNPNNGRHRFRNRCSKIDENDANRIHYKRNINLKSNIKTNINNIDNDNLNNKTIINDSNNDNISNNININSIANNNNNNNVVINSNENDIKVETIVTNANDNVEDIDAHNGNNCSDERTDNIVGGSNQTGARKHRVFIPLKAANVKFNKIVPE